MAVCQTFEFPGATRAKYEQVLDEVAGGRPPRGALYQVTGPNANGWCVVEVWESRAALQHTREERKLRQALWKVGMSRGLRIFDLANIMPP
jgi:hypothetical protein